MTTGLFIIIVILAFLCGSIFTFGYCEHSLALAEYDITELEIELEEYKQDIAILESYLASRSAGIDIEIIDDRKEENIIEL